MSISHLRPSTPKERELFETLRQQQMEIILGTFPIEDKALAVLKFYEASLTITNIYQFIDHYAFSSRNVYIPHGVLSLSLYNEKELVEKENYPVIRSSEDVFNDLVAAGLHDGLKDSWEMLQLSNLVNVVFMSRPNTVDLSDIKNVNPKVFRLTLKILNLFKKSPLGSKTLGQLVSDVQSLETLVLKAIANSKVAFADMEKMHQHRVVIVGLSGKSNNLCQEIVPEKEPPKYH